MLDLTGLPALDVAIGLAFVFFLLSTLALTIQEFLAAVLGLRARTLEQGLRSMLEDDKTGWAQVDKFYDHSLIKSLYRTPPPAAVTRASAATHGEPAAPAEPTEPAAPAERAAQAVKDAVNDKPVFAGKLAGTQPRGRVAHAKRFFKPTAGPSYISPRAFALVVLDNVAPGEAGRRIDLDSLDGLPKGLRDRLEPLVAGAEQDMDKVRVNVEAWYDDTMARVSGWYKRKTQIILIVIGVLMVPAINANTITMAERMWKDDTVRSAVVAQSQANASAPPAPGATATPAQKLVDAADSVDEVTRVGIPIGWRGAAVPDSGMALVTALFGWLLTILAISLGAPFWFDLLSRFSRLRSSGKPETPLPAASSGKSNERILTPPQAPNVVLEQHVEPKPGTTETGAG